MKMKETSLFDSLLEEPQKPSGPVTCLGMTFENDEARRAHFTEELRKKLQDPEFRKIEGFPIGSDEDILNLSDPPYYTACPNPWIADFIAEWEAQKPKQPEGYHYHREPFAADVSEGKNDPIYNAHSYHTKVPPKAIMPFVFHYTEPGDIVLDGFSGTGMTGIAAQYCGNTRIAQAFGGVKLGGRRAILNDLSPIASYISYNYNLPVDLQEFNRSAQQALSTLKKEYLWSYQTDHHGKAGEIVYTIWSELHICESCGEQVPYWNLITDGEGNYDEHKMCPHCGALFESRNPVRALETIFDPILRKNIERVKCVPVLINYKVGKTRYNKSPDEKDVKTAAKMDSLDVEYLLPTIELEHGDRWKRDGLSLKGITHTHHFFTSRNYKILSRLNQLCFSSNGRLKNFLKIWCTSTISRLHKLNRYIPKHNRHVGPMSGTLYVSPLWVEISPFYFINDKLKAHKGLDIPSSESACISCGSTGNLLIPDSSIDYIFTDPPFGANLQYSELNSVYEAWLGLITNNKVEAVVNNPRGMDLRFYQEKMTQCFIEYYRVIKPGRWITVEFHNSKNSVWVAIQEALLRAGFIVSDVRVLDKQKGTTKQLSMANAVKQDLVISAYKPNGGLEERFLSQAGSQQAVWDFVQNHLSNLPVFSIKDGKVEAIVERQNHMLFDRMVAFHVQRGAAVPISSADFYIGLSQRYSERDQMFFLPHQANEYDKKRAKYTDVVQGSLFVTDEASAIQWLRQNLHSKPQTFQEIHPSFIRELSGWNKNEVSLELSTLLEQNFLRYDGKGPVPEQIHAYLSTNWKELRNLPKDDPTLVAKARDRWYVPDPNKAGDLEKLREKALLKEFEEYKEVKKKLKVFRLEAVRAGFKKAWQERDYAVIVAVADKIPNKILEEDPKLLMWYDQAVTRMGGE
jgi:inorganic pyrophosphatase